ncbi:MAG: hypothetical protein M3Q79_02960 [bacterium]|nr:hypothetical protein [bacterium]
MLKGVYVPTLTKVGEPDDFDRQFEVMFGIDELERLANAGRVLEVGKGVLNSVVTGFGRKVGRTATDHIVFTNPAFKRADNGVYYLS